MSYRKGTTVIIAAAILGIAGCAATDQYPATSTSSGGASYPAYPSSEVARYGYVESVETATPERRTGPGIGAIGGAIAGGVAGNQVGGGSGRVAATIGGAVLGGVVGHQVEQRVRNDPAGVEYQFRVRMDDGSYQTIKKETHDNIRVGDRVRIERNNIYSM